MNKTITLDRFFAICFAFLLFHSSAAQWKSHGPYGGQVSALLSHGTNLFAGTRNSVYVSHDNGLSWQSSYAGIEKFQIFELISKGSDIYAGTDGHGVMMSADNGVTWAGRNTGMTHVTVYSMLSAGQDLFAATDGGVYYSANGGSQWSLASSGIPQGYQVRSWAAKGDTVFAGTYGVGMYRSINKGQSWQKVGNGFPNTQVSIYVYEMLVDGNTMLVSTNHGIFKSIDSGVNWTSFGSGLPQGNYIMSMGTRSGLLIGAMPYVGIYISSDNGATWTKSNNGLKQWSLNTASYEKYAYYTDLAVSGQNIVVSSEEGIFLSSDNAATWKYSDEGIRSVFIPGIAVTANAVLAATGESGVYVSSDNGMTWQRANNGIPEPTIHDIAANSAYVFVAVINGHVYRSSDNGTSWTPAYTNLPGTPYDLEANNVRVVGIIEQSLSQPAKLFQSTNNGSTWSQLPNTPAGISAAGLYNNKIYAGTESGMLFWTDDEGAVWHDISGYMPSVEISTIFATDSVLYVGTNGHGIYRFTNNGSNMMYASHGLPNLWVTDIIEANGFLFTTTGAGVYASKNGLNWYAVNDGLDDMNTRCLAESAGHLYVGSSISVHQTGEDQAFFMRVMLLSGISENDENTQARFFPNPCNGVLFYEGSNAMEVSIYNAQGKLVYAESGRSSGNVDLRSYADGVYIVKANDGFTTTLKKIIVN